MPSFASSLKEKEKQSSLSLPKVKKKTLISFFFKIKSKGAVSKKKRKNAWPNHWYRKLLKMDVKRTALIDDCRQKKKKRFPVPSRKLMHCLTRHAHMHVRQQPKQRRQQKQKQTKKKRRLVPHESWGAMPARRIRKKKHKRSFASRCWMIQWHRVLNVLVVDVFPFSWPASQLSSLTHASYTHRLDVRGLAWSQKRTNKQANKKLRTRNKQSASQREADNSTEKTGCLLHTMEKHRYKHVCYPLLLKFGLLVKQGESEKKKNRRTTTTRTHEKGGKKKEDKLSLVSLDEHK